MKIEFYKSNIFNEKDAQYFLKYFDSIMNSYEAGQRAAKIINNIKLNNIDAIIELGVGNGSFLKGIRSNCKKNVKEWIGVDTCEQLLKNAPMWIKKYNCDLEKYNEKKGLAIIALSPCLIEATKNNISAINLVKNAISKAKNGYILLSVHSCKVYNKKYKKDIKSQFLNKENLITIFTKEKKKYTTHIVWRVEDCNGNIEYERTYIIRLNEIEKWFNIFNNIKEIKSIYTYNDNDNNEELLRYGFCLEF